MSRPRSETIGKQMGTRFGAAATVGLLSVGILKLAAPSLGPAIAVNVLIVAACASAIFTALWATGDSEHPRV